MNDSPSNSGSPHIDNPANVVFVLSLFLIGYAAIGLSSSIIDFSTHFIIVCLIALTLSILYVGIQIGRLPDKLG